MDTGTVSRRVKLGGLIAVPITATLLAFAAVAFACTPQASISLRPAGATTGSLTSGPVGTNFTVAGSSFTPGSAVTVRWDGISGRIMGTATAKDDRTVSITFAVPSDATNGYHIVSANQVDPSGAALGSPANALFNVTTPGGSTLATPANVQDQPTNTDGAAALAPAPAAEPSTATPARAAATPRVRVATPARTVAPARTPTSPTAAAAPAPVVTPVPTVEATPAPVAAPAPIAPAPEAAPATAPARRSVMVSMASDDNGSPALAIALVGVGLVLALGASAVVLAGRRDRKAPAKANR